MRFANNLLILLSILILMLFSCGGGGHNKKNYYPIATGNTWTYNNTSNTSAPYTSTSEIIQSSYSSYSNKFTTSENDFYNVMNASLFSNGWGWTAAYTFDASDNLLHTLTYSPSELVFPSNTSVGTHVSQTDIHSPGSVLHTVDITVDGVESVTVPAGTFSNALKLTYTHTLSGSTYTATQWYADGVGLIKSTVTSSATSSALNQELIQTK
jgi:hypothetical protein